MVPVARSDFPFAGYPAVCCNQFLTGPVAGLAVDFNQFGLRPMLFGTQQSMTYKARSHEPEAVGSHDSPMVPSHLRNWPY